MNVDYDLLIVGGGMVGASLACALGGRGLRIGLVEAVAFPSAGQPAGDERVIALSYGTRRIFEGLGLWEAIRPMATPIEKIHISDRGGPGIARLDSREEGVEALGYVVEAGRIGAVLTAHLRTLAAVDLLAPAALEEVSVHSEAAHTAVRLEDKIVDLNARLLVAADGARSLIRRQLGVEAVHWDYGQQAVIATVTPSRPHQNVAYERFTDSGPLALLPMSEGRCAVIYTVHGADADGVLNLADAGFLSDLQTRFGDRLGRFLKVGPRQAYPLFMLKSREQVRQRVAMIGNAAHTLHPIAGQGFNLGLRDVAVLAEVIIDARRSGLDPGDPAVLKRYADWRRGDQRRTVAFTDGLVRLFTNPLAPVRLIRDLGLLAFDLLPPAKHLLARQTMGLTGRLPRLARGLSLNDE